MQPPGTWFASWKTRSKNSSANASGGLFSARTCYVLHAILAMIHITLIISYISHWEHRVTLPFTPANSDFWPVVLSASLQAFYTLYTAVLVFLTQRLAMSRVLVHRLKLTSIHDISSAWAGLGSALSSVWKQTGVPASLWATIAVTTYLVCISVLHVTSSTLLQFQTFNSSMTTNVSTTLGWVYLTGLDQVWPFENWPVITASLPIISQFPGLVSTGLSNNTVYDTSKNSIVGHATVNATTITSSCGLLPNVTYFQNNSTASVPWSDGNVVLMTATPPWADQIQVLQYNVPELANVGAKVLVPTLKLIGGYQGSTMPSVLLMVSTLLEIEPSVRQEVAVPMTWEYPIDWMSPSSNYSTTIEEVYFILCSLSTNNTPVVIDMQTNTLQNPMPISQSSTQWEEIETLNQLTFTWWSVYMGEIMAASGSSGYLFGDPNGSSSEPSIVDEYIMSLVGLDITAQFDQWINNESTPPAPNFTLTPDKLEAAIAQTVAQLSWMASRLGSTEEGVPLGEGIALVDEEVIALHLNITLISLVFATSASVIMLGLALHTTRAFDASHDSQAAIQSTGALQLLWMAHHSPSIHEALEDVKHPTEDNLRHAGMIDVCFARTISDEEGLPMGSSTDSLFVQGVYNSRDDGV